jgi:prepilin-type N-terminal cleavage/methylation domain-containing protein
VSPLARALAARVRAALRGERGMTLVELVVAMALSGVLAAMTTFAFVGLSRAVRTTTTTSQSASQARVALNSWTTLLEAAESPTRNVDDVPAFETVDATTLVFYSSLNNRSTATTTFTAPTKIRIALVGGQLIEKRYAPTGSTWPTDPTTTRNLGAATALAFTAYNADGSAAVATTAAGRAKIVRVAISITVTDQYGKAHTYASGVAP